MHSPSTPSTSSHIFYTPYIPSTTSTTSLLSHHVAPSTPIPRPQLRRKRSHPSGPGTGASLDSIDEFPSSEDAHERGWVGVEGDGLSLSVRMGEESFGITRSMSGGSATSSTSGSTGTGRGLGGSLFDNSNTSGSGSGYGSEGGRRTKRLRPSLENFEPAFASLNLGSTAALGGTTTQMGGTGLTRSREMLPHQWSLHQDDSTRNGIDIEESPPRSQHSTHSRSHSNPSLFPHSSSSSRLIYQPPHLLLNSSSSEPNLLPVTPPLQLGEHSLSASSSANSLCPPPILSPSTTSSSFLNFPNHYGHSNNLVPTPSPILSPPPPATTTSNHLTSDIKMGGTSSYAVNPHVIWVNSLDDSDDEEDSSTMTTTSSGIKGSHQIIGTSHHSSFNAGTPAELHPAILAASGLKPLPTLLPLDILNNVTRTSREERGLILYQPLKFGLGLTPVSEGEVVVDQEREKEVEYAEYRRRAEWEERETDLEDEEDGEEMDAAAEGGAGEAEGDVDMMEIDE